MKKYISIFSVSLAFLLIPMFHTAMASPSIQELITSENCVVLIPFELKPIIESNEDSYFKPQYHPAKLVSVLFAEIQERVKPGMIHACKDYLWTEIHRLVQQAEVRPFFYSGILHTTDFTIETLTIKDYIDRIPKAVKMEEKIAIFKLTMSNLYRIEGLLDECARRKPHFFNSPPLIGPSFAQQEESLRHEFFATLQDR